MDCDAVCTGVGSLCLSSLFILRYKSCKIIWLRREHSASLQSGSEGASGTHDALQRSSVICFPRSLLSSEVSTDCPTFFADRFAEIRLQVNGTPEYGSSAASNSTTITMKRSRSTSARNSLEVGTPNDTSKSQGVSNNKVQRASAEPGEEDGATSSAQPNEGSSTVTSALRCNLAPTCSGFRREAVFQSAAEMERHYAMYHTHVCNEPGCSKVFPDARFLSLVSPSIYATSSLKVRS